MVVKEHSVAQINLQTIPKVKFRKRKKECCCNCDLSVCAKVWLSIPLFLVLLVLPITYLPFFFVDVVLGILSLGKIDFPFMYLLLLVASCFNRCLGFQPYVLFLLFQKLNMANRFQQVLFYISGCWCIVHLMYLVMFLLLSPIRFASMCLPVMAIWIRQKMSSTSHKGYLLLTLIFDYRLYELLS